jgi:hypothetical protein
MREAVVVCTLLCVSVATIALILELIPLILDTRAIRDEIEDRSSSKTTQWYEMRRRRSKNWYKKHVRCNPKSFDYIVAQVTPIFLTMYPLYQNAQFSIEHRVAVTLNYHNVGDFGISGAFFGMSQ